MTDEEVLVEAKQAGAITAAWIVHFSMDELRAFARRIAEIEREECAKKCDSISMLGVDIPVSEGGHYYVASAEVCAAAIRARSEK